jgi:ribonuclease HII
MKSEKFSGERESEKLLGNERRLSRAVTLHSSPSTIGLQFELRARDEGFRFVAGIDEVGRGCLAGAVVAAAVVLDLSKSLPARLNDSKKLSENRRRIIAAELRETAIAYSIAEIQAEEIDRINILQATKKAMLAAVAALRVQPDLLLIDAVRLNELPLPQKSIIGGDTICASIAAASVLAKVYRDEMMRQMHKIYPFYGFARNVGYGTKEHFAALRKYGACPLHRKSFKGVLPTE